MDLRNEIADVIGTKIATDESTIDYTVLEFVEEEGYTRQLLEYDSHGDKVRAFLLLPETLGKNPAILINHQHNREHHLGKSEVCGLAGNTWQAFGPELVKKGFVVLAPDSICFEDRRKDPTVEGFDFWQHFDEMCYRILKGEYLMKKVLQDAMNGVSLLSQLEYVDSKRIGTLGHSYGGNTAMFLAALDERIAFCCASGCACTYKNRMLNGVGIEMASVIPGFVQKFDIEDLLTCIAPRQLLIVSSDDDKYSKDAPDIVKKVSPAYNSYNALDHLQHKRYQGGHALTEERFQDIIEWIDNRGNKLLREES